MSFILDPITTLAISEAIVDLIKKDLPCPAIETNFFLNLQTQCVHIQGKQQNICILIK